MESLRKNWKDDLRIVRVMLSSKVNYRDIKLLESLLKYFLSEVSVPICVLMILDEGTHNLNLKTN